MKKIIVIVCMLIFSSSISACTIKSITPVCRHQSVYTALTASELYHVRIATGFFPNFPDGPGHAQAQVFIDGNWQWMRVSGGKIIYGNDLQDNFNPLNYYTIDEFIKYQFDYQIKKDWKLKDNVEKLPEIGELVSVNEILKGE